MCAILLILLLLYYFILLYYFVCQQVNSLKTKDYFVHYNLLQLPENLKETSFKSLPFESKLFWLTVETELSVDFSLPGYMNDATGTTLSEEAALRAC